jgi:hypothetical protein
VAAHTPAHQHRSCSPGKDSVAALCLRHPVTRGVFRLAGLCRCIKPRSSVLDPLTETHLAVDIVPPSPARDRGVVLAAARQGPRPVPLPRRPRRPADRNVRWQKVRSYEMAAPDGMAWGRRSSRRLVNIVGAVVEDPPQDRSTREQKAATALSASAQDRRPPRAGRGHSLRQAPQLPEQSPQLRTWPHRRA